MNVVQNISAIVNSPEIAAVALQAVQAGEMAERQGLAALRREHLLKERQVLGTEETLAADGLDRHSGGAQPSPTPRRKVRRPVGAPAAEAAELMDPEPGGGHHINVV